MDWRHGIILRRLAEGCTYGEAAAAAGISRQGLWKRMNVSAEFREAVITAREAGKDGSASTPHASPRWMNSPPKASA
jgi:hypothetical protein